MREIAESLQGTALSDALKAASWAIPLLQSIHIVTIGIVFVSSLMIALRVLGRMRVDEPFALVWTRFSPWMWIGLVVMVVSGALLVIAEPVRELTALSFWIKMALLALAVAGTFALGKQLLGPAATDSEVSPPGAVSPSSAAAEGSAGIQENAAEISPSARLTATVLVALWIAIIFLGRAIAYDVEIWGALSPQG